MTLKAVSVTRILNEDDIVEAFVRHNIRHLSHMIFIDNGSTDRTLLILKNLQAEGLPLSVFQSRSAIFDEVSINTWLYRIADQIHHADWVIFLDADEFIALDHGGTLTDLLATRAAHDHAIKLPLVHYYDTPEDNQAELIVPIRMRWRMRAATQVFKLFVRGGLGMRIVIDAGNHGGFLDGRPLPTQLDHQISLAHYPRRSAYQNLQKIAIGWLKLLASGDATVKSGRSSHYRSPFETLRDKPHELIGNPAYTAPGVDRSLAEDSPLPYRGGALRYTEPGDPAMKAITLTLRYAEQLAGQHGKLLDQSTEARRLVETWNAERKLLF